VAVRWGVGIGGVSGWLHDVGVTQTITLIPCFRAVLLLHSVWTTHSVLVSYLHFLWRALLSLESASIVRHLSCIYLARASWHTMRSHASAPKRGCSVAVVRESLSTHVPTRAVGTVARAATSRMVVQRRGAAVSPFSHPPVPPHTCMLQLPHTVHHNDALYVRFLMLTHRLWV
jgi:hypothetical protein